MKLIPISEHPDAARILYQLLEERPDYANISHRRMPTWEEHLAFIASDPYKGWFLLAADDGGILGAAYVTDRDEIGVHIFANQQRFGYGPLAVRSLIDRYGLKRVFANIAPANEPSRKMFEKLGFKLIQHTLALEAE